MLDIVAIYRLLLPILTLITNDLNSTKLINGLQWANMLLLIDPSVTPQLLITVIPYTRNSLGPSHRAMRRLYIVLDTSDLRSDGKCPRQHTSFEDLPAANQSLFIPSKVVVVVVVVVIVRSSLNQF